jgi:hypothetical protein
MFRQRLATGFQHYVDIGPNEVRLHSDFLQHDPFFLVQHGLHVTLMSDP